MTEAENHVTTKPNNQVLRRKKVVLQNGRAQGELIRFIIRPKVIARARQTLFDTSKIRWGYLFVQRLLGFYVALSNDKPNISVAIVIVNVEGVILWL